MRENENNNDDTTSGDHITLYGLLTDQVQKYNTLIWGLPIGLLAVNILALDKFLTNGYVLIILVIFNLAILFAHFKMIWHQKILINASMAAEKKTKGRFRRFYS